MPTTALNFMAYSVEISKRHTNTLSPVQFVVHKWHRSMLVHMITHAPLAGPFETDSNFNVQVLVYEAHVQVLYNPTTDPHS